MNEGKRKLAAAIHNRLKPHPRRFRDTFAVDMLLRGASPYDVAKVLGDTIEKVESHYMPFVKELRERVRTILESGVGLEELAEKPSDTAQITSKKPNLVRSSE